jgi:hypothetical protein
MTVTKKLPVPINAKTGRPRKGSDFLIPLPAAGITTGFVGISSGRRFQSGALVYIGVPISAADIRLRAAKFGTVDVTRLSDKLLDDYLGALAEYKIGNVLSVTYAPDGTSALAKIAEHITFTPGPPLP